MVRRPRNHVRWSSHHAALHVAVAFRSVDCVTAGANSSCLLPTPYDQLEGAFAIIFPSQPRAQELSSSSPRNPCRCLSTRRVRLRGVSFDQRADLSAIVVVLCELRMGQLRAGDFAPPSQSLGSAAAPRRGGAQGARAGSGPELPAGRAVVALRALVGWHAVFPRCRGSILPRRERPWHRVSSPPMLSGCRRGVTRASCRRCSPGST